MLTKVKIIIGCTFLSFSLAFGLGETKLDVKDSYSDREFEMGSSTSDTPVEDKTYDNSNINAANNQYNTKYTNAQVILKDFPQLKQAYEQYLLEGDIKIFALAVDDDGGYAYGYSYRWETKEKAKSSAFGQCNKYKGVYDVKSPCRVFAEGNTIVW